jgi:hypothetical protein
MVFITGTCRTCGYILRLPGIPLDSSRARLDQVWTYPCPGGHRMTGRLLDGYEWDWIPSTPEALPTDEEYARGLVSKYGNLVFHLGDGLHEFGINDILAAPGLEKLKSGELCDAHHWYLRHDSPRQTTWFFVKRERR